MDVFLGPKTQLSAKRSVFCHMTPNLVNGPFEALRKTVLVINFLTFRFQDTAVFEKKDQMA